MIRLVGDDYMNEDERERKRYKKKGMRERERYLVYLYERDKQTESKLFEMRERGERERLIAEGMRI